MKPPFLATQHNIDPNDWTEQSALKCKDKSLAQQQFRDEVDINNLFGRYLETGEMPQVLETMSYGNFEGIFDFQTAMNSVRAAQEQFNELPARIKNRFDNDPQKLVQFMGDPENRAEAEFLGLVTKPQENPNETGTGTVPQGGTQAPTPTDGTQPSAPASQGTQKP